MKTALYIHIPFCLKKCNYCDFYSIEKNTSLIEQYIISLLHEIKLYSSHNIFKKYDFQTIYIGGGTPSILSIEQLKIIFDTLFRNFNFTNNLEITIEINPETITYTKLYSYTQLGINRLSIGVQSFNDKELNVLQRIHNVKTAITTIENAHQNNFENFSIDLIFAIPGQSLSDWKNNLQKAISFNPKHISIYGLTYEPGTVLTQQEKMGTIVRTTESLERDMYLTAIDFLEINGYSQYEISNFAKQGYNAIHNTMYWNNKSYIGLGPAAHSYWQNTRQWNVADIQQYCKLLNKDILPVEKNETITADRAKIEFIMLNLRKAEGINLKIFENLFEETFSIKFYKQLQNMDLYDNKLYIIDNENFKLTKHGFLLYNEICSFFI